MGQKPTLFNYLHDALVQQIVSGKISYGEKLPSLRSLCELYHVGIRTARDVTEALVQEGYVEAVQRSHIRAVYQSNADVVQQVQEVLARKDMVLALIRILAYVMPPIYADACKFCDEEVIMACRTDIAGIDALSTKDQWRMSRIPLQRIKTVFHNDLLKELCIDFDLSAQIVIVPGFDNPYNTIAVDGERELNHFFDCIVSNDRDSVYNYISKMYHTTADLANAYFEKLACLYPMEVPKQVTYFWNAERGRSRIHMQVTRSIIKKISKGIYENETYLPSSLKLCEEYKISSYTVGNVMETLEKLGLVKKTNRRGGYLITCQNACKKELFVSGGTPSLDAMTFLGAIHLLALLSEGIAAISFPCINKDVLEQLTQKVNSRKVLELSASMMSTLIQVQPYEPLRAVYSQIEKFVDWGCYISFAFNEADIYDVLQEKCEHTIQLIRNHDQAAFEQAFKDIYRYVFQVMQSTLVELGIEEANKFRL